MTISEPIRYSVKFSPPFRFEITELPNYRRRRRWYWTYVELFAVLLALFLFHIFMPFYALWLSACIAANFYLYGLQPASCFCVLPACGMWWLSATCARDSTRRWRRGQLFVFGD
jgi:hypothetical protein